MQKYWKDCVNKDAASQSSVSFYLILFCRKNIPAAKKFITKRQNKIRRLVLQPFTV